MRHIYRLYDESCVENFRERGIKAGFIGYGQVRSALAECMRLSIDRFDSPIDGLREEIRSLMETRGMPEEFWTEFDFPSVIAGGSMHIVYDFLNTVPKCGGITTGVHDGDVELVFGHDGVRIDGISRIDWQEEHPF